MLAAAMFPWLSSADLAVVGPCPHGGFFLTSPLIFAISTAMNPAAKWCCLALCLWGAACNRPAPPAPDDKPGKPAAKTPTVALESLEQRPDGLFYQKKQAGQTGPGQPFNGVAHLQYPNGKPRLRVDISAGRFEGPLTRWSEEGWKHLEMTFVAGRQDGVAREYNAAGEVVREEQWQQGRMIQSELSAVGKAQVAALETQRATLDKSLWAEEEQAQLHEETFVAMWDAQRAAKDKWASFENFAFSQLVLGRAQPMAAQDAQIEYTEFAPDGETLTHEQWRAAIAKLRQQGVELEETEWHQERFVAKGEDGFPYSEFNFHLHARAGDQRRYLARGKLGVHWTDKKDSAGHPVAGRITVRQARLMERPGEAPFRTWAKLDPGQDNPATRTAGAFVEPMIVRDLDGDHLPDILLPGCNLFYRNKGAGQFDPSPLCPKPVSKVRAAVLADLNNDGRPDLLCFPANESPALYLADVQGRFSGAPLRASVEAAPLSNTVVATVGDVDGDGDLDVFAAQYKAPYQDGLFPTPYYDANDGWPAYLLLNDGSGNLREATVESGLASKRHRRTYSASLVDLDGDHDLDLVVVSDFSGMDLYLNDGKGRFTDVTAALGDDRYSFGMSHALADFNRDGHLDIFMGGMGSTTARRLVNMGKGRDEFPQHNTNRMKLGYGNRLLLGDGKGGFKQMANNDQVARTGWAWGSTAVDFDNDGDRDLYIANGNISRKTAKDYCTTFWRHDIYSTPAKPQQNFALHSFFAESHKQLHTISWNGFEHNVLLMNQREKNWLSIGYLMGVGYEFDSRCVVSEDMDNDGRPDLLVAEHRWRDACNDADQFVHVVRNQWPGKNHWIGVRLTERGASPHGAMITVRYAGGAETVPVITGDSYASQHSLTKHFGLGAATAVESIQVRWPNGKTRRLANPGIDQYHEILPE